MKRLVAACGLALMLINSGQQTHAFCHLTDCADSASESKGGETKCCQSRARKSCQHSEKYQVGSTRDCSTNSPKIVGEQHGHDCPNPNSCWCCQPTPPQQAPSPIEADTVVDVLVTCIAPHAVIVDLGATRAEISQSIENPSVERAFEVCVRLCRFLV
jgi:hypothetical protein